MIRNQGIVLSRSKIEQLRKKIDQDFEPKLIHTIRGAGYVLRDEDSHE